MAEEVAGKTGGSGARAGGSSVGVGIHSPELLLTCVQLHQPAAGRVLKFVSIKIRCAVLVSVLVFAIILVVRRRQIVVLAIVTIVRCT